MNWLTLNDQERLCCYANEICKKSDLPDLFTTTEADSYFTSVAVRRGNTIPDIMRYEPVTIRGLRDKLNQLWEHSDLPEKKLIIDIVAVAALKNEPFPIDHDRRLNEWKLAVEGFEVNHCLRTEDSNWGANTREKTSDDDPLASVLVYEF
ncbi:MAG: hypothetical protein LBQ51_03670 [Desulfovibrio sp.]|jgi:hypothetical protein|nr:hypothetical protein [Desulfovibrio sp.]